MLQNIKHPLAVKELIHEQVEDMKIRRRVRVGEIMTSNVDEDDDDNDTDDDGMDDDM